MKPPKISFTLPSFATLKSLKISSRIAISSAMSALLMLAVGAMFILSEQQKTAAIEDERHFAAVQQLAQSIGRSNLLMRQFEKDFILRDDLALAELQRVESTKSAELLDQLAVMAGESEMMAHITATQTYLQEYRSLFDVLVETSIEISANADSGFFFDFTEADKAVAAKIKPFKSDLINLEYTRMRLAERNFVIAGGDRNILGVDKQIKKVLRAAQKQNVDPMARIELADLLEVYNVGFDEYAGAKARHLDMQTQLDGLYQSMVSELAIIIEDADVKGQAARTELAQVTQNARTFILSVIGVALLLMVLAGLAIGWTITQPLKKITTTMRNLAGGDLDADVPFTQRSNELGEMARAVEVFRANGLRVNEMTEEEKMAAKQRTAERADMMQELQRAFGEVVDAAVSGDFTRRVEAEFPDEELNRLAHGVNELVETVDRGVTETGEVLAALANTDLTKRMEGDYQGSFLQLKNDTNRVGDKLTEVISSL
ncbi:HAMP domain-containing protein, partial [Maritalea porphyrae]